MKGGTLYLVKMALPVVAVAAFLMAALPWLMSSWLVNAGSATMFQALTHPADQAASDSRLSEAAELYRAAWRWQPDDPRAAHNLGIIASRQGDTEAAERYFLKSSRAPSRAAVSHFYLGNILEAGGRHTEAVEHWRSAGAARFFMAQRLALSGWAEQSRLMGLVLEIAPDWGEAHYHLAHALQKLDRPDQACAQYTAAVRWVTGPSPLYWLSAGHGALCDGDSSGAISAFENATRGDGEMASEAMYWLGRTLYYEAHDRAAALAQFQRWADSGGGASALAEIGRIWQEEGDFDAARDWYRRASAVAPPHDEEPLRLLRGSYVAQARQQVQYGRLKSAEQAYREAISLWPDWVDAHIGLGQLLAWYRGDYPAGIAQLRAAIEVDPTSASAFTYLGRLLRESGQLEAALPYARWATQLEPDHPEANLELGRLLAKAGAADEGLAEIRHALALRPGEPGYYAVLGEALFSLGRRQEAIAAYRQALELRPGVEPWQRALTEIAGQ